MGHTILNRNRDAGLSYFAAESKAAENTIAMLSHECRLQDAQARLEAIMQALTGREIEIDNLGALDSDDLIEHGAGFVCMYQWCYMPNRIRLFDDVAANRDRYALLAVVAAGMLAERSLPCVHGQPGYHHIGDVAGSDIARQNLVTLVEYVRVLRRIRRRWPGARRLIDFGLRLEADHGPRPHAPQNLLFELYHHPDQHPALERIVNQSVNVFDTVQLVTDAVCRNYPQQGRQPLPCYSFLPDFRYHAEVSTPAADQLVADLKADADHAQQQRQQDDGDTDDAPPALSDADSADDERDDDNAEAAVDAAFVYDEWCHTENDYLENYCRLHETVPEAGGRHPLQADVLDAARRVRKVFECLKPDLVNKEKYLDAGDTINTDLLYDFIVDQHTEPAPDIRFYEKPLINQRDLAVLVLLDTSGSTSEQHGHAQVLELEKQAATILAEGLHSLGDRFEIGGFSSNGPENCNFLLFKEITENWDDEIIRRLHNAHPANSTRMGVALRHAGWRLSRIDARQRLIILITDGKPMDTKYSPETRYAQFDVRTACEENQRQGIATFAISTEENTLADMEIMFTRSRFAILDNMQQLPQVLPRLYIRLTA